MKPGQTFDLSDKKIQSLEEDGGRIWDALGQNISGDEPAVSAPPRARPAPKASGAAPQGADAPAKPAGTGEPKPSAEGPPTTHPLLNKGAADRPQPFVAPAPAAAKTSPSGGQSPVKPQARSSQAGPSQAGQSQAGPSQAGQSQAGPSQRDQDQTPSASARQSASQTANQSASQTALSQAAQRISQQRSYRWFAVLGATLASLFVLLLLVDTLTGLAWLFGISRALGLLASLLLAAAVASLVILLGREWRALSRMSRQRHLRQLTEAALFEAGAPGASEAMAAVEASYARQDETAWMVAQFRELAPQDAYSAADRLEVFEREVLRKLDSQAVDIIEENARNTAIITTISPFALFDALFTLWRNLRMIRQVATVYGVAPGFWGSMRLLRQVFANVLLTGGLEAADGALNQLLGGSLTARLSAKLSEGLVNGMLSARLGLAAMDQCRPLPFKHNRRPRLSDIGGRLVNSVRKSIMKGKEER